MLTGRVIVSANEVAAFARKWPCSNLPEGVDITFEFAANGDLVDVDGTTEENDGPALLALSEDAQAGLIGRPYNGLGSEQIVDDED